MRRRDGIESPYLDAALVRRWCRKSSVKVRDWKRWLVLATALCTAVLTLLVAHSLLRPDDDHLVPHASLIAVPQESESGYWVGGARDVPLCPPSVVGETLVSTGPNVSLSLSVGGDVPVGELPISRPVEDAPDISRLIDVPQESESGSSVGGARDEPLPQPSVVDETLDSTGPNVSSLVSVGGDVPAGKLPISRPEDDAPDVSRPLANSTSTGANDSSGGRARPWHLEERISPRLFQPDQALVFAKKEIAHTPLVGYEDPDLYSPLFRNVSVFKRSYELMERILKVYVYREGEKPIFHTPPIKGIYASEGWFMKLMENNKKFVTKDPNKAHLFYLPYSVRQLELALYVSDKHNMKELSLFLKNYVNKIASKYRFWNRTHGSDHFLVACHDWGPYTTKEHDELFKNAIKVLCNADVSEGIFVHGRDISLPETSIAVPRRPLRNLGGKSVSQRKILAFFAGYMHGRVRPILLKYWSQKDEDMRIYGPLPKKVSMKMSYVEHMKSSKFCICPMGYEVNSPRIVEALYYECVPVIIADNFVPPLDDVLDWSRFSVIVNEKDIPNLKDILLAISFEKYVSMQRSVRRLQKHFLWHRKPVKYDIFHMILHSIWFSRLNNVNILS